MARTCKAFLALLLLAATGCGSSVRLVRGTDVVPGEASHADPRPPAWLH
jgi:hypothetical protein